MLNFDQVTCTLKSVLGKETGIAVVRGDEDYFNRVADYEISLDMYDQIINYAQFIGIGETFKDVIKTFDVPEGETPAGFKLVFNLEADAVLKVDLKRDIAYDKNGKRRPTETLFSVDSANPYEIEPCAPLVANLTCNPGIIYDLFINNPKANVGGKFKDRDEVMAEIGRILGPGCDISVELNNPFEKDFGKILEEAERFREMLSKWRVVIKVRDRGCGMADVTLKLLAAVPYYGCSDVEFKRDARDGRLKLMEINPRQGLWSPLARAAGVNLAYIAYCDAVGKPYPTPRQIDGVRWTDMLMDGPSSVKEMLRGDLGPVQWLGSLRGVRVDCFLSASDPLPGLVEARRIAASHARRLLGRLRAARDRSA